MHVVVAVATQRVMLEGSVGNDVDHECGKGVLIAGLSMNSFMRASLSAAATFSSSSSLAC
eukprot:6212213-Pleurochrysis_carterae.AAC.4